MRWKIIVVNAGIVLMAALLAYFMLATALTDVVSNPKDRKEEAARALRAANAQLALDGVRLERWAAARALSEGVRGVFSAGTAVSRSEAATAQANRLRDGAVAEPDFAKMAPSLVAFVDSSGVALGRNGSNLMRGDKLAEVYPSLKQAVEKGETGSDVWLNRQRQEQLFVSYAPVRGDDGKVIGALVVGTPLNDERLQRTSELTGGQDLVLAVPAGDQLEIVASSGSGKAVMAAAGPAGVEVTKSTLGSGTIAVADKPVERAFYGAAPLLGYGDGKRAVLLAAVPASLVGSVMALLWPIFGAGAIALVLVIVAGVLLGNFISRPIAEIEEGLLAIMNGRTDLRFQLEHPDLGGVISRLNSVLNALTGTQEDTTDDEGRPSRSAASPGEFDRG